MCLSLINKNGTLLLAAAFENGFLSVYQLSRQTNEWSSIYRCQAHSQPVLSIDIDPRCEYLLTSAADSVIAKHPLVPVSSQGATTTIMQDPIKSVNTKHSGQQGLTIRSDGKIFATAGWDANIRVYSAKTLNELAVLQWHQVGVYAVAFAKVEDEGQNINQHENEISCASTNASWTGAVERRNTAVAERRLNQAKMTHWVVAGAKDGKLSLWSIY
jgi:WD40 repeat protein